MKVHLYTFVANYPKDDQSQEICINTLKKEAHFGMQKELAAYEYAVSELSLSQYHFSIEEYVVLPIPGIHSYRYVWALYLNIADPDVAVYYKLRFNP